MKFSEQLKSGVILDNPVFMQTIGLRPTLATTTSLQNAIGMGAAATVVLICSNIVISAMRRIIPDKIRIAAFITIIATFVTMIDLSMQAFPAVAGIALGLFPAADCSKAASSSAVPRRMLPRTRSSPPRWTACAVGLGLAFALVLMGFFRELLGAGTVLAGLSDLLPFLSFIPAEGFAIPGLSANPAVMMILPAGGFLMMGFIFAVIQKVMAGKEDK